MNFEDLLKTAQAPEDVATLALLKAATSTLPPENQVKTWYTVTDNKEARTSKTHLRRPNTDKTYCGNAITDRWEFGWRTDWRQEKWGCTRCNRYLHDQEIKVLKFN